MDSEEGMGDFRYLSNSIDEGDIFNGSMLKDFTAHAGKRHVMSTSLAMLTFMLLYHFSIISNALLELISIG